MGVLRTRNSCRIITHTYIYPPLVIFSAILQGQGSYSPWRSPVPKTGKVSPSSSGSRGRSDDLGVVALHAVDAGTYVIAPGATRPPDAICSARPRRHCPCLQNDGEPRPHLRLLALYRLAFPRATADEIRAFLFN